MADQEETPDGGSSAPADPMSRSGRYRNFARSYRALFEAAGDAIFVADVETGRLLDANPAAQRLVGRTLAEIRTMGQDQLHPDADRARQAFRDVVSQRLKLVEMEVVHRDGRRIPVEIAASVLSVPGSPPVAIGLFRDVSERRRVQALQSALYQLAEVTAVARDLHELYPAIHEIVASLMPARNLYVALREPGHSRPTFPYFSDELDAEPPQGPWERGLTAYVLRTGEPCLVDPARFQELVAQGEVEAIGGESIDWMGAPLLAAEGPFGVLAVQSYNSIVRYSADDLSVLTVVSRHVAAALERKKAEERIRHQAFHDALTKLPNRLLFRDRLSQAIAQAERRDERLALMFMDLDRFKAVNDSLGHAAGDSLLEQVALRLQERLRDSDTVARVGGDEFLLLVPGVRQAEDAARVARKLLDAMREPFRLEGHDVRANASVGLALYPEDGRDAESLIRNADVALYRAKATGRDRYQLFSPALTQRTVERLALESRLRGALERDELRLSYQPQLSIPDGRLVGAEALLKWQGPDESLIPNDVVISMAEETGAITSIVAFTLTTACREAAAWRAAGRALPVAVNVPPRQPLDPGFTRLVHRALEETGLPAELLHLEVVETTILQDGRAADTVLGPLSSQGVRLVLDRFGTGTASVTALRALPFRALKIDRSLVRDCLDDPVDAAVVRGTIALAHSLGLRVTAVGVETLGQMDFLVRHRCDTAQGYLFSRPVAPGDVHALANGGLRTS